MKKALVLTAVLCLAAAMSPAAILEAWVTVDNANPNVGQTFNVSIWLEVVPDPSVGETWDTLSISGPYGGSAIESAAVSVYQKNPDGNYAALPESHSGAGFSQVATPVFNSDFNSGFDRQHVLAARVDIDAPDYFPWWGPYDFDALEASGATLDDNLTFGVGTPVLLCTESWTCLTKAQAYLHVTMPYTLDADPKSPYYGQTVPAGRYWSNIDVEQNGSYKVYFSNYEIGALVDGVFTPGVDLVLNPDIPEPATLAFFALGAMGLFRRRR